MTGTEEAYSIELSLKELMYAVDQQKKNLGDSNPVKARKLAVLYTELEKSLGYYLAYLKPISADSPSEK